LRETGIKILANANKKSVDERVQNNTSPDLLLSKWNPPDLMTNVVEGDIPSLWDPAVVVALETLDHHNAHTIAESIWQIWSHFLFLNIKELHILVSISVIILNMFFCLCSV